MVLMGELRTRATIENLRTVTDFCQSVGRRLELGEKTLFQLDLAIEEAAANIVEHAYLPGKPGDMMLCIESIPDAIRLTLTDWGIPFDPDTVSPFDIHAPIETRMQGGMGLHFIHSMMDDVRRQAAPDGANTLILTKYLKPAHSDGLAEDERGAPSDGRGMSTSSAVEERTSTLRELNAMLTVSGSMTAAVDIDDMLVLIINELVQAIHAERGAIYLIDEDTGELYSRVLSTDSGGLAEIRLLLGQGLAGHVAASGETLNIRDAYSDPRFQQSFDQLTGFTTRSILTVPMRNPQGEIVGVVQVVNKRGGAFSGRDERLLKAIATQAAISIENARLYAQEMQQRLIEPGIGDGANDPDQFSAPIHPHARRVGHCGALVPRARGRRGLLRLLSTAGRTAGPGHRRCIGQRRPGGAVYGPQRHRAALCHEPGLCARRADGSRQPGHHRPPGIPDVYHRLCGIPGP